MGWLHVLRSGKGVYLPFIGSIDSYDAVKEQLHFDSFDISPRMVLHMYPGQWFRHLDQYSKTDLALLLGVLEKNPYGFYSYEYRNLNMFEQPIEKFKEVLNDTQNYPVCVVGGLAKIFANEYGYPPEAFRSLMDYNGDYMLYCCATFPFPEEWESLTHFSEAVYQQQLDDFFTRLTGKECHMSIEVCEEYVKE